MSQRFEAEQWVAAPLPRVFTFFADPRNLPRIMPPKQGATLVQLNLVLPRFPADAIPPDGERMAGVGTEIVFKFRAIPHLPMHERWTALITEFSLNEYFRDTQKQGPFRRGQHTHSFEAKMADGREGTLVRDVVEYEVGFGVIGKMLERLLFQRMLRTTFQYRKEALEKILREKPNSCSPIQSKYRR
jgi:ligand-binding SRPBCC domain-containing protein